MLRAPFNSFQHRADQALDDGVSDVDALASNEAAIAGSPLNFFDGAALLNSSPGGAAGIKPVASSTGASASSMSLNVQTAPAVTVADGASVEISGVSAQSVTFTGTTGTLKLDDALAFTGEVSGLAGSDAIDLADVSYGPKRSRPFWATPPVAHSRSPTGRRPRTSPCRATTCRHTGRCPATAMAARWWLILWPPTLGKHSISARAGSLEELILRPDGTMVARTDTYGAYLWNGTEWVQLVTSTSMPAAFVAANVDSGNTGQGVYEIQIADSNTQIFYMMYDGYVFKSTNQGTTWTQTSFAQVTANPKSTILPNTGKRWPSIPITRTSCMSGPR